MRLLTHILKKPSQVVLGRVYRIAGNSSTTDEQLPPQIFRPRSRTIDSTGFGFFEGEMVWRLDLPDGTHILQRDVHHQVPFRDVNVSETGQHYEEFSNVHLEWDDSDEETIRKTITAHRPPPGPRPPIKRPPRPWYESMYE